MTNGYYTNWATSIWLTFWDKERSGNLKDCQRLCIDKEMHLNYFIIKNLPKPALRSAIRMFNKTYNKDIDIDSREAKELQEIFNMFIQDVDSEWQKKEQ